MNELLTFPWISTEDSSPITTRMAAWAAREIIEQRYDPGALLTEADLAEAQKASRTPDREAMLQLNRWRLVRLVPKQGAIVTTVTSRERCDLLAVRAMCEIDAVQALTSSGGFEPLAAELRPLLDRQREALKAHHSFDFASSDHAFHARIIYSDGDGVVDEMLSPMGPRPARLTYRAVIDQPTPLGTLFDEHDELTSLAEIWRRSPASTTRWRTPDSCCPQSSRPCCQSWPTVFRLARSRWSVCSVSQRWHRLGQARGNRARHSQRDRSWPPTRRPSVALWPQVSFLREEVGLELRQRRRLNGW